MTENRLPNPPPGLIASAGERFFSEGGPVWVELEVFGDQLGRLRAFAQARGVTEAEALRLVLPAGLAFMADQQVLQVTGEMGGHSAEELERLLRRHVELEADYAVLKHRLWLALQDNQTMSLRDGTLSKSVQSLQLLAEKLRSDVAQLQAENATLQSQVAAHIAPPVSTAPPPRSWTDRLARFWRGRDNQR